MQQVRQEQREVPGREVRVEWSRRFRNCLKYVRGEPEKMCDVEGSV